MQFAGDTNLTLNHCQINNTETGGVVDRSVNADNAKEVGDKIMKFMKGRTILDFSFIRKHQIVTIALKTSTKIGEKTVQVNQLLLFQICTAVANGLFDDI